MTEILTVLAKIMLLNVRDLTEFCADFDLQILINVPFSYYAFSTLFYPFLTQRTKSKFVIARPSKVTETLLK